MNGVFGPGAGKWLRGRGGLRAQGVSGGSLMLDTGVTALVATEIRGEMVREGS